MNNRHGLPARPNFSTPAQAQAGPSSQPRAGPAQPRPPQRGGNQPKGNHQQPAHNLPHAPYPPNLLQQASGGYPYAQHQYAPQFGMGYQPNLSGGYPSFQPQQMYQPSPLPFQNHMFGQTQPFFPPSQPQPHLANSAGYSYSSTYTQSHMSNHSQPPNKRHRPNPQTPSGVTPDMGTVASGMWRNCSQPGCKFVGPSDKVQTHEEDRHLIFVNGKMAERSEEEERFARRKGPLPPIQGTNITLNTPEEIEKWIAERKAKWPSKQRIKEKEDERAAAIARGEIPTRGRHKGKKMDAASLAEEWGKEHIQPDHPRDNRGERGRGRGRGRGLGADRGRGQGRERGRGRGRGGALITQRNEWEWEIEDIDQDQGWTRLSTLPSVSPEKKPVDLVKPTKDALIALEGYDTPTSSSSSSSSSGSGSESDSGSESSSESVSDSDTDSESDSDTSSEIDTSPLKEGKETYLPPKSDKKAEENDRQPQQQQQQVCTFARQGTCRFGNKCKNSHEGQEDKSQPTTKPMINPALRRPAPNRPNHFARPSMLGSLLANPIQNTISQISQTIRFLVANDMLDGVELKPGDAQKEEEEKNKVKDITQHVDPAGP
ncbi:uncharacterized protein I303_103040 [Kwoniella dejecticola CBS 10117]|uniref:C3H1-type domain-containing protein n=1 Tax=Kwoniella dejecticola CBS 10117 TaxID=1296121 RepID=A0A1A6AAE7_9TREE|nr:uncharacterized protein I303_03060 [Kwoniella dejecticola CBS 10117]OBR87037.1 hypothetical protein I303_03060 [Kwoniella dejecticola CBS 10117]